MNVVQWAYRVDYGPSVRPQLHTVSKDRRCQCSLGTDCPAVAVVGDYLRAGGERAPDPPFDFWPRVPETCPICGAPTAPDCELTSREHGQGWRCNKTGLHCYWAARVVPLMLAQRQRQYVIPPVGAVPETVSASSPRQPIILAELNAWVTAERSQTPKYPGITAGDMAEAGERAQVRRAAWAAEGYCPND
ncbi:MAG: hypothetical protein IT317_10685 [Anaerolineales bacterium]|nr:hypothetical protein [Anaerolineales bacterium]